MALFNPEVSQNDDRDEYPEVANPYDRAKERNAFVVESRPGLLMCDLDTPEALASFYAKVMPTEPGKKPTRPFLVTRSPGGRSHGYVIDPSAITLEERIQKQLELGSDPVREKMSRLKIAQHLSAEIVLFETANEYYRATHWIWERLKTSNDILDGVPATKVVPF